MLEEHADSFAKIFEVLFKDGYDPDAGFVANIDKSKESDGKTFYIEFLCLHATFGHNFWLFRCKRTTSAIFFLNSWTPTD